MEPIELRKNIFNFIYLFKKVVSLLSFCLYYWNEQGYHNYLCMLVDLNYAFVNRYLIIERRFIWSVMFNIGATRSIFYFFSIFVLSFEWLNYLFLENDLEHMCNVVEWKKNLHLNDVFHLLFFLCNCCYLVIPKQYKQHTLYAQQWPSQNTDIREILQVVLSS